MANCHGQCIWALEMSMAMASGHVPLWPLDSATSHVHWPWPLAMAMAMGGCHDQWPKLWAIDSIRASTGDLVCGYPGKTHLPGQSGIWAYPGIRANWREACLPLYPGRTKLSGIKLAYPGIRSTRETVYCVVLHTV